MNNRTKTGHLQTQPQWKHLQDRVTTELAACGFLCFGSAHIDQTDPISESRFGSLILIGSTGPGLWPVFQESPEFADSMPHPLDRFTKRVLTRVAADFGLLAVFPFEGPPYYPFQQWALKTGGFSQSPLGVLVHGAYGPWAGFRGALLCPLDVPPDLTTPMAGPCETCTDKPCMSACPVNAISLADGYDVSKCQTHLRSAFDVDCWFGCLARRACPYGQEHRQGPENARFHMQSFAGLLPEHQSSNRSTPS